MNTITTRHIIVSGVLLIGSAIVLGMLVVQAQASNKVRICHVTSSETKPVIEISVSTKALAAHLSHGDVIPALSETCVSSDDPGDPNPS